MQKNVDCMARSAGRTVHFGRYFVALTATLDLGTPAGVYQGYDAQSDWEAASLLNGTSALKLFCPDVSAPFFLYSLPLSNVVRRLSRPSRSSRRRLISASPTTCHLYISPTSVPRKIPRLFLGRTCFRTCPFHRLRISWKTWCRIPMRKTIT